MSLGCYNFFEMKPPSPFHSLFKKQRSNYAGVLRRSIKRLRRTRRRLKEKRETRLETELTKAIKLYRENSCIMRENRKLRARALELLQENKILLSQLESMAQPRRIFPPDRW